MKITIHATPENTKTILDLAEEQGFSLPCNCHGANACGGRQYDFPCGQIPHSDVTVRIPDVQNFSGISLKQKTDKNIRPDSVLIDLGTTTIAIVFYNSASQTVFHSEVFPNPQRTYGADVISRILYDVKFHKDYTLKNLICAELENRYETVLSSDSKISIRTCLIGGNTTMIHLLMGYPLDGMKQSPFTPFQTEIMAFNHRGTSVYLLPWLSAFIGGDITAGLLSLHFDSRHDTCLLADLGTNGELALLHHDIVYTASTAAGPAFEGGGLSCGCPAIPGALSDLTWHRIMPKMQTIDNKLAIGICGSGAISILSELIRNDFLLPSGILSENFPETGLLISRTTAGKNISFTANDVRQMQLAVAAIGAGIDTLCHEADISPETVSHLYLAGGLGYSISVEKASLTGLFSGIPVSKITPVGNSCLNGLASLSARPSSISRRIEKLKKQCREQILADNPYFEKQFIHHMTYEFISTL